MTALDDALSKLEADVTAETTADQSAITLLNGITAQLKAILAATGDPAAQLARVQALTTALEADTTALSSAVTANTTPPAPAP